MTARISSDQMRSRLTKYCVSPEELSLITGNHVSAIEAMLEGQQSVSAQVEIFIRLWAGCGESARNAAKKIARRSHNWRIVPSFSKYEVSGEGEIRRRSANAGAVAGRALKQKTKKGGHRVVGLYDDSGKQTMLGVHRIVCAAFHGPPPRGKPFACHIDGDPANNSPDNLYWGDPSDNAGDRANHERGRRRAFHSEKSEKAVENPWNHYLDPAVHKARMDKKHNKNKDV